MLDSEHSLLLAYALILIVVVHSTWEIFMTHFPSLKVSKRACVATVWDYSYGVLSYSQSLHSPHPSNTSNDY